MPYSLNLSYSFLSPPLLDPLTTVAVIQTGGPAALHEPFTLMCEVPEPADTILWWKDDQPIFADNTTVFDVTNKTLTFSSAQLSDNGNYQCQAFNAVSNVTSSPYELQVNCKSLISSQCYSQNQG